MKDKACFKSDVSGQIIVLTGFVIAIIIFGMGTVLYSVANSGQQSSLPQSDRTYDYFENIREEYGTALMISSEEGEINPFNVTNTTTILEFEDRMKTIMESHGFILNFTWDEYIQGKKRAIVNILFTDGNKVFNDTVTYNLLTGEILYDTIPPGRITDLYAEPYEDQCILDGAVILNWTAVGDDYYEDTSAYKYEIRYSNESIYPADFDNATFYRYYFNVKTNGTPQEFYVEELDPFVEWHFAIKVYDKAGNFNFSNSPSAEAYEWAPEIDNITGNSVPINESEPELQVNSGIDVIVEFNVTDRDGDNVSISFMIKNESEWITGDYWTDVSPAQYNYETFNYTFENIRENWDFYINVTDNSTCDRSRTSPEGAPDNNYYINLTDYIPPKTFIINYTFVNDTFIDENSVNTNYGDESKIKVKNVDDIFGLIKFDLSPIPTSATIESAEISLYLNTSSADQDIKLYRISQDWNEDAVTWGNWNPIGNYSTSANISGTIDKNYIGWYNWSAFTDVEYFHHNRGENYGWLIRVENTKKLAEFDSKEAFNESSRPVLSVTYSE